MEKAENLLKKTPAAAPAETPNAGEHTVAPPSKYRTTVTDLNSATPLLDAPLLSEAMQKPPKRPQAEKLPTTPAAVSPSPATPKPAVPPSTPVKDYGNIIPYIAHKLRQPVTYQLFQSLTESDFSMGTFNAWAEGRKGVPGALLPKLKIRIPLDDRDYDYMLALRFPALNKDWLADREPAKRIGLLVGALRELGSYGKKDPQPIKYPYRLFLSGSEPLKSNRIRQDFMETMKKKFSANPATAGFFDEAGTQYFMSIYEQSENAMQQELQSKLETRPNHSFEQNLIRNQRHGPDNDTPPPASRRIR